MNSKTKIAMICAALVCVAGILWMAVAGQRPATLTYSQFLQQVRTGQVVNVVIRDSNSGAAQATCRLKNGNTALTVLPSDYRDVMAEMQEKAVDVEIRNSSFGPLRFFTNVLPVLLLLGLWIFLMNRKFPNGLRQYTP